MIAKYKDSINLLSSYDERIKYKVVFIYLAKFEMSNSEFSFGIFDGKSITLMNENSLDLFIDPNENYKIRFPKDNEIDKNYKMIIGDEIFMKDGNMKEFIDYYADVAGNEGKPIRDYIVDKYLQEFTQINMPDKKIYDQYLKK